MRCSTCGRTHDDNRSGETFACQNCGSENHADYDAAKNIGWKYLLPRHDADDGGAPVDVRSNRGTLNVSGEYVSPCQRAIDGVERASTPKPHPHRARSGSTECSRMG